MVIEIAASKKGATLTLAHELAPGSESFITSARGSWEKMLGVLSTLIPSQPKVAETPDLISLIYICADAQSVWDAVLKSSESYFFGHTMHVAKRPSAAFSVTRPDGW